MSEQACSSGKDWRTPKANYSLEIGERSNHAGSEKPLPTLIKENKSFVAPDAIWKKGMKSMRIRKVEGLA